jgi:ribonuclease D
MPVTERTFVSTPSQLATGLARLGDPPVVGVDVERADANRYWRSPALIQLGVDGCVVLVDPLELDDLGPLDKFLRTRTIVLHAMENDITPLQSVSVEPGAIEDTAVAAAILGLPTGLEALLDQLLDVSFNGDKQRMQRADWAKRPLTDAMLEYAAADVADLPHLWAVLADQLSATGRRTWYEQERDAVRLNQRAQTRARSLWQARETLARDTDTAPNRILSDRTLLDLAANPVNDVRGLRTQGMRRQSVRRFGPQLLAALHESQDATLVPPRPRMLDEHDRTVVDRLRAQRSQIAARERLDPGVLCPNRSLERAVGLHPATPAELRAALDLRPWQWDLMVDAFVEALDLAPPGTPTTQPPKDYSDD